MHAGVRTLIQSRDMHDVSGQKIGLSWQLQATHADACQFADEADGILADKILGQVGSHEQVMLISDPCLQTR